MNLKDEFYTHLTKTISYKWSQKRERNIDLIMWYYGFSENEWPTLEETSEKFNITSRERPRQIIRDKFKNNIQIDSMESFLSLQNFISSKDVISSNEVKQWCEDNNLSWDQFNIISIIRIMHDADVLKNYQGYVLTYTLEKMTRHNVKENNEIYLIKKGVAEKVKKQIRQLRTLPCKVGAIEFSVLDEIIKDMNPSTIENLKTIIKSFPDAAILGKEKYFSFYKRESSINGFLKKAFSLADSYEIDHLSEVIYNALFIRTFKSKGIEHTPKAIVKEYIENHPEIEISNSRATYNGNIKEDIFTDIENEVISYFKENPISSFSNIHQYLIDKGFSKPSILHAVNTSPIVFVNRTDGRKKYKYSLISSN